MEFMMAMAQQVMIVQTCPSGTWHPVCARLLAQPSAEEVVQRFLERPGS